MGKHLSENGSKAKQKADDGKSQGKLVNKAKKLKSTVRVVSPRQQQPKSKSVGKAAPKCRRVILKDFKEKGRNNNAVIKLPDSSIVQTRSRSSKSVLNSSRSFNTNKLSKGVNIPVVRKQMNDQQNQCPTPKCKFLVDATTQQTPQNVEGDLSAQHDGIEVEIHAPDAELFHSSDEDESYDQETDAMQVKVVPNQNVGSHPVDNFQETNLSNESNANYPVTLQDKLEEQQLPQRALYSQQGPAPSVVMQDPDQFKQMFKDMFQASFNEMVKEYGKGNLVEAFAVEGMTKANEGHDTQSNLNKDKQCDSQGGRGRECNTGEVAEPVNAQMGTVKSPSDTTLYTPAMKKRVEGTNMINRFSDFVESIRLETTVGSAEPEAVNSPPVDPQPGTSGTRDRIRAEPAVISNSRPNRAKETADNILLQVGKFKADIISPKGIYHNVINEDNDDDFFHVTCHIDSVMCEKIERGEFVDLEKLT